MTKNLPSLGFVSALYNERHDVGYRCGYVWGQTAEECSARISEEFASNDDYFGANMASAPVAVETLEGFDWRTLPEVSYLSL